TKITQQGDRITLDAPFECYDFTLKVEKKFAQLPVIQSENNDQQRLDEVQSRSKLQTGKWFKEKEKSVLCFQLSKGRSTIMLK
ncbi:hypothetical protein OAH05_02615, partial [bacterium]|nr:hypothetical protein [bacterium]